MGKLTRRSTILAKAQPSAGTDPVPTTANGIICSAPTFRVNGEKVTRDYLRNSLSPLGFKVGTKTLGLDFQTELKGSGVVGTEPKFAPLLLACGFAQGDALAVPCSSIGALVVGETVSNGDAASGVVEAVLSDHVILSSVVDTWVEGDTMTGATSTETATVGASPMDNEGFVYKPISTGFPLVAAYYWLDGIKHAITDARGSCAFTFPVGDSPKLDFKGLTGLYVAPADVTNPSGVTFDSNDPPSVLGVDLSIGSFAAPVVETVSLDIGVQVNTKKSMIATAGIKEIAITGRQPSGNIDPAVEALATFNPFAAWAANTKQQIMVNVGSTYGNRVTLVCAEAQLDTPGYQDRNGDAIYSLPFVPTGEDDEVRLIIW